MIYLSRGARVDVTAPHYIQWHVDALRLASLCYSRFCRIIPHTWYCVNSCVYYVIKLKSHRARFHTYQFLVSRMFFGPRNT